MELSYSVDFERIFYKSDAPALLLDPSLTIIWCNEAYERSVGRLRCELKGRFVFDAFPVPSADQQNPQRASLERVLHTKQQDQITQLHYDLLSQQAHADARYWQVMNTPILNEEGDVVYILNQPTDISVLVNLQHRDTDYVARLSENDESSFEPNKSAMQILAKERSRLHALFQQAPGFICILRGRSHIYEMANQSYLDLIGRTQIIGKTVAEVLPEIVSQGFISLLDTVYKTGEPYIGKALPIQLQRQGNQAPEFVYLDLVYQPITDHENQVTGIFVQGYDVTEAHTLTQQIRYEALRDGLTGLFNRREMINYSAILEATKGTHAVLYLDLDHFKIVNDRCGHHAGDELLVQLARLMETVEHEGRLARVGGDEFVVLLQDCLPITAVKIAESYLRIINDHTFIWESQKYSVGASIGVAFFGGETGYNFVQALSAADSACFLAKDKGRGRIQIADPTDSDVKQQINDMDWVNRLKIAMRDDRIILFGQKIVALNEPDKLLHKEVLSRLQDENGEFIAPGAFIIAAERYGLIEQLDRHILNKVFQRLNDADVAQPRLFVNVSGITLSNPSFVQYIDRMLDLYPNVDTDKLCIEVTETAAVTNIQRTAAMMTKIRERGIEFALDDFGSGVATFSYLDKLPIRYVKIDGEFIQNVQDNPVSQAIVSTIKNIADVMDLVTIAERIEEAAMLEHLHSLGIDLGQGYAIHRPEPL
ncbi:MAG: EAL domain-containing protein [Aliidiomarina sp.]|uniref:sensor domain-containing protein n=1 Tax=Aliidiomarina sp. TaxID=1872439 RepID=UPI0025BCD03A|nr:EAL domain-containing protein [Aliidiomarina sp.]MCH8501730.1 EAL domain-containing protein [Aliidiomarina sp.]